MSRFGYYRRPREVEAVQWRGDNLAEVRELFPEFGEPYLRDKGVPIGAYLIKPPEGGPFWWKTAEYFEEEFMPLMRQREGIPEHIIKLLRPEGQERMKAQQAG